MDERHSPENTATSGTMWYAKSFFNTLAPKGENKKNRSLGGKLSKALFVGAKTVSKEVPVSPSSLVYFRSNASVSSDR